jgi:hypothetical protein
MQTFGEKVKNFYYSLQQPKVPKGVDVLYPFDEPQVKKTLEAFYGKYFNDTNHRTFLIGINPGRYGGGVTGIPFTDPQKLSEVLGIPNTFDGPQELSSRFIYQMIDHLGGVESFYQHFYFTSVSPLGFTSGGKNLNYYDTRELQDQIEKYMVENLKQQISFGAKPIAFSLGMGKNIAYLMKLNQQYRLFEDIRPLPHPRWIMQYRLKRVDEFLKLYFKELSAVISPDSHK